MEILVSQIRERIDEMVTLPMVEQGEDDGKKVYDINSFDQTEDERKVFVQQIAGYKDAIKDNECQLSTTHARIEAVLDESGVKETEIRQKQHSEFVTLTDNNAALGCLSDGVRLVQSSTELRTGAAIRNWDMCGWDHFCRDPKISWSEQCCRCSDEDCPFLLDKHGAGALASVRSFAEYF